MLLCLAPGLRVVRRGHDHVQVGLHDDRRLVLPRSEATRHVLDRIEEQRPVDLAEPGVAALVARLVEARCVETTEHAEDGPGSLERRHARRRDTRVAVVGGLGPPVGTQVGPLLEAAGLGAPVVGPGVHPDADVALLLSRGEPDRERLDPWLRSGLPHLVVRVVDAGVVLGPFVLPGRTACLRCVDAHRHDVDPDHLPVLARYAEASRRQRHDGSDDAEPALVSLGLSLAVRDLLSHADGHRPATCARTIRLGPEPHREQVHAWALHPECGCTWPVPGVS